ncbi:hypothetical protein D8770_28425 [Methylobacterium sp. DB1607]|nr:hypothetical protein [Methylobacterium sp. DB1607]
MVLPVLTLPAPDAAMRSVREAEMLQRPAPRLIGLDCLGRRSITPPAAFRIVEDPFMTDTVEDWSEVRSPSRAARRRRQGHRQRIRFVSRPRSEIYHVGDMLVMHPETARKLRARIAARGDALAKEVERRSLDVLFGMGR